MIIAVTVLILFLIFPEGATDGAINGLRLCASAVIPSLFPYFVVTQILTASVAHNSGGTTALLMSLLGGYPIGVSTVTAMYASGKMRKKEAERALLYCNNSGPGFFVGMIGTYIFGSVWTGLILYAIHVCSALIGAALFQAERSRFASKIPRHPRVAFSERFLNAVTVSCESMLRLCGLVVFFSVILSIVSAIGIFRLLSPQTEALARGILELTGGIARLSADTTGFISAAFLMGWGGLCVHMQAMCLWQKAGLQPHGYYFAKLLQGAISAFFALVITEKSITMSACAIIFFILCQIFPIFRQKWGSQKRKIVV